MVDNKTTEELSVDICIIGAAGAGLCAAARAKECGAGNVLILEKMDKVGGCTSLAGGMFAVGSDVQKRWGYFYNTDELFLDLMYIAHWDCDAKLVRKWYNKSADIIRWFEDKGIYYDYIIDNAIEGLKVYHIALSGKERTGRIIVKTLVWECRERGVEIRTETRATKLLTNDEGAVVGVLATQGDKELRISAKCVVIATGSISNNPELMARFYPPEHYDFQHTHIMAKVPHNTGDGLIMAEEIGASTRPIHTLYIGPQNHPFSHVSAHLSKRPEAIKLTRNGERYQDENVQNAGKFGWMAGTAQNSIPEGLCYSVVDESILRRLLAERIPTSTIEVDVGMVPSREDKNKKAKDALIEKDIIEESPQYEDSENLREAAKKGPMAWMDNLEETLRSEANKGRVCIANTLDEVADWIGCDLDTLKATIDEYNCFCRNGHDADFCKDPRFLQPLTTPPYYIIRTTPGIDTCIGGLRINHRLEVLNKEWQPIKGLYAAGVVTGGWLPKDGYSFAGSELSFTCYSGYTVGETAAKLTNQ